MLNNDCVTEYQNRYLCMVFFNAVITTRLKRLVLQCSPSVSVLWALQDHLSRTALAWRGMKKPADRGLVAPCCPNSSLWKQADGHEADVLQRWMPSYHTLTPTNHAFWPDQHILSLMNEQNRLRGCGRAKHPSSSRLHSIWMWQPWNTQERERARKRDGRSHWDRETREKLP